MLQTGFYIFIFFFQVTVWGIILQQADVQVHYFPLAFFLTLKHTNTTNESVTI